ncbi:MAG: dTDP-4-dehydrorhamnose 3,5-epimerase [Flavobacteriales bacterium]|nr:dTDP-4-dehydrorhamnose 3,5-epimerase [Flavobacteriales bacterium]
MNITPTSLEGAMIIEAQKFGDERGYFMETYNRDRFVSHGITEEFVQDNLSLSKDVGTLRGIHLQEPPYAQAKLVSVLKGRVMDIAVDLRVRSRTFGQYVKVELSGDDSRFFLIPAGFGHAFITLEPDTIFQYKCSNNYNKDSERTICWNDPDLAIEWGTDAPILSAKDTLGIRLADYKSPF